MADRGGLQLIPDTRKKIAVKTPGENRLLYIGVILMILVAALYVAIYFYIESLRVKVLDLGTEITSLEQQRDKEMEKTLSLTAKRAMIVSGILDEHVYATQIIDRLTGLIQEQVQVSNLTVKLQSKRIEMKIAATSYTVIAKQIAAFMADSGVSGVELGKIQTANDGLMEVGMNIIIVPEKFFLKK